MKKGRKRLYDVLFALCILVFVGSGCMLVQKIAAQKKNDSRLEDLSSLVTEQLETEAPSAADDGEEEETQEHIPTPEEIRAAREARLAGYQKVKELNSDMVGWVKIEGTKIDYPVLQSLDSPNFYLTHDFDKNRSAYGAPYVAEECDLTQDCPNILVYGHHMKNGSMFAALDGYLDKSFYEEHPIVQFDTLDSYGDYQVMAVFTMSAVDQDNPLYTWISAGNEEAFNSYVSYIKEQSVYDTGVDAQWGDHLLSLITCEYTHQDGRLIVVAKKIEEEADTEEMAGTEDAAAAEKEGTASAKEAGEE